MSSLTGHNGRSGKLALMSVASYLAVLWLAPMPALGQPAGESQVRVLERSLRGHVAANQVESWRHHLNGDLGSRRAAKLQYKQAESDFKKLSMVNKKKWDRPPKLAAAELVRQLEHFSSTPEALSPSSLDHGRFFSKVELGNIDSVQRQELLDMAGVVAGTKPAALLSAPSILFT